jgi:mannose-6-phosphate isomerase
MRMNRATADESIYPYLIDPKETPAIWGGDALVKHFKKRADPRATIGESWECWDTNRVLNGPLAGTTIAELRATLGASLLGDLDPLQIFPVLTKIIDARDALSVQVHPDDAYAQRVENQRNGKTEGWYILSAAEGAELVYGWAHDTTREEYERRVADGTLGDILRRVPVKAGETYYLPAGTLHAIGAGIVLFETQQASDLTYRIFDWNRVGTDGKPRPLHVAKAADVLDYRHGSRGAVETIEYAFDGFSRTALIASSKFVVERIVAGDEPASLETDERPLILMAMEAPLMLEAGSEELRLEPWQTALIPAAATYCAVTAAHRTQAPFLFVTPPAKANAAAVRMLAAGVEQARIDHFMEQFA